MSRHRNAVNALLFFAPIGVVLSAIPQAPDFAPVLGWALTLGMLLAALLLALRGRRADAAAEAEAEPGDAVDLEQTAAPTSEPSAAAEDLSR
ncbi:hypothetical protein [Nesterenkonia halotolerans]|uniref:Na+-driven multidrug efflux pump n=1 Tax=Nesterenkonia halotolerans TaxID=225325 RepID=A0ABR9J7F0_9MICC|nr:hypothetical protein [Nesterenkonia halotolerans]MBE1514924.1 Na+-driven multidrug efflux pump [Nesterenkonia halotolerans]